MSAPLLSSELLEKTVLVSSCVSLVLAMPGTQKYFVYVCLIHELIFKDLAQTLLVASDRNSIQIA